MGNRLAKNLPLPTGQQLWWRPAHGNTINVASPEILMASCLLGTKSSPPSGGLRKLRSIRNGQGQVRCERTFGRVRVISYMNPGCNQISCLRCAEARHKPRWNWNFFLCFIRIYIRTGLIRVQSLFLFVTPAMPANSKRKRHVNRFSQPPYSPFT